MLILHELADQWAREPQLRQRCVAWRWFAVAAHDALHQAARRHDMAMRIDTQRLCRAFFDWVRMVELHEHLEARNGLDFRHAMAGLLLQQLFTVQGSGSAPTLIELQPDGGGTGTAAVTAASAATTTTTATATGSRSSSGASAGGGSGSTASGTLFTSLALTLLQALRQQTGAAALVIAPGSAASWSSYLENATQDPATATCYLDQMCGLAPQWQAPGQIDARPGMQGAIAAAPLPG